MCIRDSDYATYLVSIENYWGADGFPAGFPLDGHFSWWGGVLHDDSVSFWNTGSAMSPGMEEMAETGRTTVLVHEEGVNAINDGSARNIVDVRLPTSPQVQGIPGTLSFEIRVVRSHPLLSMVSMLGPSPDWFVGVDDMSFLENRQWRESFSVDLPLHDGGSKSNATPVLGGPDVIPPLPVGYLRYDMASGTYVRASTPHNIGRIRFERLRTR